MIECIFLLYLVDEIGFSVVNNFKNKKCYKKIYSVVLTAKLTLIEHDRAPKCYGLDTT